MLGPGLELGDDLGDGALLVLGEKGEALADVGDAGQFSHFGRLRAREGQLGGGQKEVVDELVAGLAELRQIGEDGSVLGQKSLLVFGGESAPLSPAETDRPGDQQVGAHAGQGIEDLGLGVAEP
ncbi:MAG: hypothetical protein ACRDV9_13470 [Acidimicrobiia bacterium]